MQSNHLKSGIVGLVVALLVLAVFAWRRERETGLWSAADARTANSPAPARLRVGGWEVPVAFEDGPLSFELREAIVRDLQLVYGHMDKVVVSQSPPTESPVVAGKVRRPTRDIWFDGEGRHSPDEHHDQVGHLVDVAGVETLVVPRRLIDAYAEAFARKQRHRQAYDQLPAFIEAWNSLDRKPPREMASWILMDARAKRQMGEVTAADPAVLARELGKYKLHEPSLLEIKPRPDLHDLPAAFRERLIATTLMRLPDGRITNALFPLVYHDGRWKILLLPQP